MRSSRLGMSKSSDFVVSKIREVVGRWAVPAPARERRKAGSAPPVDVEDGAKVEVDGGEVGLAWGQGRDGDGRYGAAVIAIQHEIAGCCTCSSPVRRPSASRKKLGMAHVMSHA